MKFEDFPSSEPHEFIRGCKVKLWEQVGSMMKKEEWEDVENIRATVWSRKK